MTVWLLCRIVNSCYFRAPGHQGSLHGWCGSKKSWRRWTTRHCSKPLLLCFAFNLPLISFSFEQIDYRGTTKQFWKSIGQAIQPRIGEACVAFDRNPIPPITSQQTFLGAFLAKNWALKVVILIDELSELHSASKEVRDDFLRALRVTRNDPDPYAIESVIAAGTFSILLLIPSQSSISPFNVSDRIDNSYFTVEETRTLFDEFAQDHGIMIDNAVVEDIWVRSNGCFSIARIKLSLLILV